ncbi:MAG: glycosyltransferase family 2 protein [Methylacidiphilales bacterium]|nr:glycosyltransferase family 2 protein [Candidatus Methylacidiphilales bacterium]
MQSLRWPLLFGSVLGLLIFTLYASFAFQGVAAWSIGVVYIAYDSLLLAFMVVSSQIAVMRQDRQKKAPQAASPRPGPRPSLTVLICARNERLVLPDCLRALAAQTEPADEIIILDDGSTDSMVEWLTNEFALAFEPAGASSLGRSRLWPALRVWRKPNSGKADSLNLGWKMAQGEIVVTLDADTCVKPGALAAIRDGFVEDPNLGIAGGVLMPVCQRTAWAGFFQFFQTFEYARGFLWRLTWMQYDMLLLVSGAFAAYRRSVLEAAGGFDTTSWVEDYELTHRVYRDAFDAGQTVTVKTLSGARGTTDAPASVSTFLNQRRRWFAGFIATHFKYHAMVANRRYGAVGRYMLCFKTLDLLLPIYALAAVVVLVVLLSTHHSLNTFIVKLIVAKLLFDLILHAYSIILYQRWLGIPLSRKLWIQSIGATLSEPFVFQIMRQFGAVLGWLAFMRRKIDWLPQRPVAVPSATPG